MATMLTGHDLADKYRAEHPDTSMSRNCIVCLLRGGCIPSVTAGSRRFYSYERFTEFLEQGNDRSQPPEVGTIRRIG